jgi:rare lipoprotein A
MNYKSLLLGVGMLSLLLGGCTTTTNATSGQTNQARAPSGTMLASWYMHGSRTANGERFQPDGLTAAHKSLPFGTKLHLTHNGKTVIVRINDRGPFIRGRQLDLSRGAARQLGCLGSGTCRVSYRIVR